jgi:stage II sporulation protein D
VREPPAAGTPAAAAALETRGLVLTYSGQPFPALFSASCGGRTRTLAEAGMADAGYPYFAVECPVCAKSAPVWELRLAPEYEALVEDRTEGRRIELARRLGWAALPGSRYEIVREGGAVLLRGRGEGHGIGLCQRAAAGMAAAGAGFREILAHYYPNTAVNAIPCESRTPLP